ncbi:hypothetical protein GQ53DRAFT_642352 [Thozetella sp. PMI_491]|nr:hypothetical protein GQ53DRAFT_642352 [Thozetella sp. PMI_491]
MPPTLSESIQQEWQSLKTPAAKEVAPAPKVGDKAPSSEQIPFPSPKPVLIVFLRHCGCPFAEKTFKSLSKFSSAHPEIHCIAVSHSTQDATDKWVVEVGGEWEISVLVDYERDLYAQWGLGISTTWHALNPWSLYSTYRLGKEEGIWNRATESGTRWQTSGAFAVDAAGIVRWAKVARTADDVPNLEDARKALEAAKAAP